MGKIKFKEQSHPVEKKLVAVEMSKDMWKSLRLQAVENDISFSAHVRWVLGKHLRETGAKLEEGDDE